MVLRFRRWNRLATADGDSMHYRVLLEIRGFPAHAWSATTAQIILGDACAAPEPTPTTTASADFRRFQTVVWCSDPDLIPNEAVVRIPEKVADPEDNNLFLRPDEIIHHELRLLAIKLKLKSWNSRTGMILGHLLTSVRCRIVFFLTLILMRTTQVSLSICALIHSHVELSFGPLVSVVALLAAVHVRAMVVVLPLRTRLWRAAIFLVPFALVPSSALLILFALKVRGLAAINIWNLMRL